MFAAWATPRPTSVQISIWMQVPPAGPSHRSVIQTPEPAFPYQHVKAAPCAPHAMALAVYSPKPRCPRAGAFPLPNAIHPYQSHGPAFRGLMVEPRTAEFSSLARRRLSGTKARSCMSTRAEPSCWAASSDHLEPATSGTQGRFDTTFRQFATSRGRLAFAGLAALVVCAIVSTKPSLAQEAQREVIEGVGKAKDGDGILVGDREVRLAGIDAPELGQESCHTNLVTDLWQRSSVVGCRNPRMPDTDFHR